MLIDLIRKVSFMPHDAGIYNGVRKIVRGVTHRVTTLPIPNLEMLGYKEAKIRQLLRNYYNEGEISSAKKKLQVRRAASHTSVSISTLGGAKDSRSQGFCIRNLIITQTPKFTEVDIIWRSTELIQKNTADYALIPLILQDLDIAHEPSVYRMYFGNAYVTALFMPLLFINTDGIAYFEQLKQADPKYFKTALSAFAKFTEKTCRYNYKHRVKMYNFTHKHLPVKELYDYCADNGASFALDDDEKHEARILEQQEQGNWKQLPLEV